MVLTTTKTNAAAPTTSKILSWWPKPTKPEKLARHVVAVTVWAYGILTLFVFDLDAFLTRHLPASVAVLISYKLLFFIGITAIVLATASTKRIIAWAIYIAFYPLTRFSLFVLFAGIMIAKAKSWPILFSVVNVVLSFARSFKANFILSSAVIIGSTIILCAQTAPTLWTAAASLTVVAAALIARRFVSLFRPSQLLQMYTKVMALLLTFGQKNLTLEPSVKALPLVEMDQQQIDKWASNLQSAILYNELCQFLIRRFADYRRGGLPTLYYFLNFFLLLAVIIFLFTMINIAIYRADIHAFVLTNGHSFFDFLYYAFSGLFFQRIPDTTPISVLARLSSMAETFFAFMLGALFIAVFFAVRRNLDDASIEEAIITLRSQAEAMEAFVHAEFSLSLDGAISELERLKKGVSKIIDVLRAAK
jgi:hypothetical protein